MLSQRAFRQRKEKHVKQLEDKLAALEAAQATMGVENALLQKDLKRATVENTMLRSLSTSSSPPDHGPSVPSSASSQSGLDDDQDRVRFTSPPPTMALGSRGLLLAGRSMPDGGSVLQGREIWDFIVGHRLFQEGLVDMRVMDQQLQGLGRADTDVPVVTEALLIECIERSLRRY
jgi:hypothetical protein